MTIPARQGELRTFLCDQGDPTVRHQTRDRIPSLVDELRLCDQSVITDLVAPSWAILIAEDRSQLALAAGMVT
ncbi:hypothetical protein V6N13_045895 [Hibiscus sabdariffa]